MSIQEERNAFLKQMPCIACGITKDKVKALVEAVAAFNKYCLLPSVLLRAMAAVKEELG